MPSKNKFVSNQRNNVNHFNYYYFTNVFTDQEIEEIIQIGESQPKIKATTVGEDISQEVTDYRVSDIAWLSNNPKTSWVFDRIADLAIKANSEMWNFDIWDFQDDLQYTSYYGNGGHYDWHADLGQGISNRKLSIVLQLSNSDEYEGGDVEFKRHGLRFKAKKGDLLIFPSNFMYHHQVYPVTDGLRYVVVQWIR